MASAATDNKKWYGALYIKIVLSILVVSCGYYFINAHVQYVNAINLQKQKEVEEKAAAEKAALQLLYDKYLNNFKNELGEKAQTYKKNKQVLKALKNPYNYETPQYTKENYELFKKDLAPKLRKQSDEIVDIFDTYSKKVKENLGGTSNETEQIFIDEWQKMAKTQLRKYVIFFTNEEKIISAYDNLITFYYVHSNLYSINLETGEFIFSRKEDEKTASNLLRNVERLERGN